MSRHSTFFELVDALRQAGCPLCQLSSSSVQQYFISLGHEQVNDVELRAELRTRRGFCARHAWLFLDCARNRLGVAIVYRDLVQHALQDLKSGGPVAPKGRARSSRISVAGLRLLQFGRGCLEQVFGGPGSVSGSRKGRQTARSGELQRLSEGSCSACLVAAESEQRYASTLLDHLREPDLRQQYAASEGLCLWHLWRVLETGSPDQELAWLRADSAGRLERLAAELTEYIRKHDYRFQCESWGSESDAPGRAIERSVGPKTP